MGRTFARGLRRLRSYATRIHSNWVETSVRDKPRTLTVVFSVIPYSPSSPSVFSLRGPGRPGRYIRSTAVTPASSRVFRSARRAASTITSRAPLSAGSSVSTRHCP